jgi:hypothetical protein
MGEQSTFEHNPLFALLQIHTPLYIAIQRHLT